MINVKRFIDRVSRVDANSNRDFVMPVEEARALRDEIAHILADKIMAKGNDSMIEVEIKGGKF